MNCRECEEQLSPYVDSDLAPAARQTVEAHLRSCAGCRGVADGLAQIATLAAGLPRHAPGSGAVLRVKESLRAAGPAARRQTEFGPVLDAGELLAYLHIDEATLDLYAGEIPFFELGGKVLFRRQSVDEWIRRREQSVVFQAGSRRPLEGKPEEDEKGGGDPWKL